MTDNNNKNIVAGLKVEFTRKNKKYIKDLSDDMIKNIKEEDNIPIIVSHLSVNR